MSRSPYFFVERYNFETKKYELAHPLVWNKYSEKYEIADLFPYNGCHDMFSIAEEQGDYPNMRGIHYGMPEDATDHIKKEYGEYDEDDYYRPTVRWFTYADLMIYLMKYSKVENYSFEDDNAKTDNPMTVLDKRIRAFMEVVDGWDWEEDASHIRIIYWIC